MKILIIEDEQPAAQKLTRLLNSAAGYPSEVVIIESVEKAVNWLLEHPLPDLIFMDIQLEDGLCFEIFEKVPLKVPVIFTTAYDEYALKAFKVNSVDYLLKPVEPAELAKALEKFRIFHEPVLLHEKLEKLLSQVQPAAKERFLVKVGEHFKSVLTTHIHFFFIRERCSFLRTCKGKEYPVDYSLEKLENVLDTRQFFRVNRNYIVNFHAIRDIIVYSSSRLKIVPEGWEGEEIVVSRERVQNFKDWMDRG